MTVEGRTYLDLQEEVLAFQFAPAKYRPLVKTWLNDAQRLAVTEGEIRTQESSASYTTISGDATLELPADFSRLIDLHAPEVDRLLDQFDLREFDTYPPSTGRPYAYTVEGEEIRLYPSPDGAYELDLRYWHLPADMVADGDEPEIPKQHHHRLVAYAMWKAYARENDATERAQWKADWEAGILKMRGEVQSDMADGPRQVRGSYANAQVIGG